MAIPRTNLDEKSFDTLVEEALRIIPGQAPDWTNHNRQDPGITLVELFAWLTEMQQYYLNQIGEANYRKYLKLLGERAAEAKLATADVTFGLNSEVLRDVVIPKGTKLLCKDETIVFETVESLLLTSASLEQVVSSSPAGLRDNTDVNVPRRQPPFFAFGEEAEVGSKLYLGFGKRTLFTWQELPGAYSERVRDFLDHKYGLVWAKDALLQKSPDDRKIAITRGDYTAALELKHNGDEFRVALTVLDEPKPRDVFFAEKDGFKVLLQPFSAGQPISLSFALFDDYPVPRGSHGNETEVAFPSACIRWEYFDRDGQWSQLPIGFDSTRMLAQSGRLYFTAPKDMWPRRISPSSKELYWLRATVLEAGYELPPQIDSILLNTVSAVQRDSLSESVGLLGDGQSNQSYVVSSYLALKGTNLVQVRECNGCWRDWEERTDPSRSSEDSRNYTLAKDRLTGKTTITFGDGEKGNMPPKAKEYLFSADLRLVHDLDYGQLSEALRGAFQGQGKPLTGEARVSVGQAGSQWAVVDAGNEYFIRKEHRTLNVYSKDTIRLISYDAGFADQRFLGRSNGLPNQVFKLDQTSVVVDSLRVQVRVPARQARQHLELDCGDAAGKSQPEQAVVDDQCWCDWERVDDFDGSKPNNLHYVFDVATSEFLFGDGEHGDIPSASTDGKPNIRIIACQIGGGVKGNVQAGEINRLKEPITDLEPAQLVSRRKLMVLSLS